MALIRFIDGKNIECSAETGARIWAILNGEQEPANDKELHTVERVKSIYLSWRTAPDSYVKAHFNTIAPMVIGKWMIEGATSASGQTMVYTVVPTRPDPANSEIVAFSKKWGLYKQGKATDLAKRYM